MRRNKFSLSHTKLFSCDTGELVPCGLLEVLPGDSFQHNTSILLRCSPLLAPVMHKLDVRVHHWFVPHRLSFDGWEDFITGGPLGTDATTFPTMTVDNNDIAVGDLLDYMGVPPLTAGTFSALPARAYARIFNEFYRDADLDTPLVISTAAGADTTTSKALQRVRWAKDYFTSARPFEQKGPSISLPLGVSAPVVWDQVNPIKVTDTGFGGNVTPVVYRSDGGVNRLSINPTTGWSDAEPAYPAFTGGTGAYHTGYATDLTGASAITVARLREALALQRYEEARARYGSRYPEYLRYLGVRSSDARLQRPEYLGGGRAPIQFSEVLQTAEGEDPVGEMRGHGIGAMRSNRYRRFFEEHGYVLSLLSVRPQAIYADGLPRTFTRTTKEDFWQKEFETIGQQEVFYKEVRFAHATPNGIFGYQDRYDEYRSEPANIAGEFRTVLDHWHFARLFSSDPALNSSFVRCEPADDRVFAVPSQDVLYIMAKHSVQARRLVARTGKSITF